MMRRILLTSATLLALTACEQQQGSLSLQITDAPVTNAENVFLAVNGVTLKGPDGQQSFEFLNENNEPKALNIDLLTLTGDDAEALVSDWSLPAGEYQWIRLDVATDELEDSYVILEGDTTKHEISIPSGELKLNRGFTIPANGTADFTLDVDLYKALVLANGNYKLKPVIRMIDNAEAGHIAGTVDSQLYATNTCTTMAVYAMADSDTPAADAYNDEGPELVAWVEYDDSEDIYQYELGFLTAGDYTLHLACDAEDDPEVDDDFDDFIESQNVTVVADETVTANF